MSESFTERLRTKVINDLPGFLPHLSDLRRGKSIVFTNGCFDVLHPGHVLYLNQARDLGDFLIVGLNSDTSVRALKGPKRPIHTESERAMQLASMSCVDFVFVFAETTPERVIELIKPDIHVKGGDYAPSDLPEKRVIDMYGGRIIILPFSEGHSTTAILKKGVLA